MGWGDARVVSERQIREPVVAQGEMMSVARSAVVEVARPLTTQDRSVTGSLLVPHDALAVIACAARCRREALASIETLAAARPRRLAFRYEANPPPGAL
jgi:hypothetical protein